MFPLGPASWGPTLDLTGVGCVNEEGEQMEMLEEEEKEEEEELELQIGTLESGGLGHRGSVSVESCPEGNLEEALAQDR